MKNLIDKILIEWSYRVHDGMPNINNSLHIVHLREAMQDLKLPKSFIVEYIQQLFEADEEEKPLDDKEKEKVKSLGLVWKGYAGGYGKEGKENPVTHKNKGGKLVPVSGKEGGEETGDEEESGKPKDTFL